MPANPSLIDTVSQVLLNNLPTYGQQRDIARKVLQALLEAGPTPSMVQSGGEAILDSDDDTYAGEAAAAYRAMLRAALEETGNV